MKLNRVISTVLCSLLLVLNISGFTAFAETALPDGAVKGLPERLAALDSEGRAVNSETGEYFFHVEDMEFGEVYSKNIQMMNLREDESYHIYFYVEPLYKSGKIDLEKGCECRFYLDGEEFYKGSVYGDGNIDLKVQHFDCGLYTPGQSHNLRAEVVWNDLDCIDTVDNGWRLIDKDGEHILVEPDGTTGVKGEIEFKWIFYSMIETKPATPDTQEPTKKDDYSPQTGITLSGGTFWLICLGVIAVAVAILLVLILRKKKGIKK